MSGDERRRALLDHALKDKELIAQVSPVVALAFGVLPLRRRGQELAVACLPDANPRALGLLREVLGLEIVATPFEERPLQTALSRAYHGEDDSSVNFPTFQTPDFLERPGTAALLREPKVERVGEAGSTLAGGLVLCAAWSYRSSLGNLDHPRLGGALPTFRATKYDIKDEDLVWSLERTGAPLAWTRDGEGVAPGVALLLNELRFSDHRNLAPGALFAEHAARGASLSADALPLVVHPTEVQLVRLEGEGSLVFHVYDHEERIEPSGTARGLACSYYFLSFGSRLHREIEVEVHELIPVERARLATKKGRPPWSGRELERWFRGTAPLGRRAAESGR